MNQGIQGPSPPVTPPGLALGRQDAGVLATVLSFMGPGVTFDQAVQDAIDAGAIDPADLQRGNLEGEVAGLDSHQRQQLASHPDSIPPTVRHELEHLGVLQPQADARPAQPQSETGRATGGDRQAGNALQGRGDAQLAFAGTTRNEFATARSATPAGRTESAATAPTAAPSTAVQPSGTAHPGAIAPVPAGSDAWLARLGTVAIGAGRIDSPAIGSPQERASNTLNQATLLPHQAVPATQARGDALAAQMLPQGAALATVAQPQGTVVMPQVQAPMPGGTTAAIGGNQQRPERQAPAGHTQAASATTARRDGRAGAAGRDTGGPASMLDMLIARRRRRDDDESSPFQWLFWILTLVAYGALAIAAFALVSGSSGLVDGAGRPGYGAYALAIGALGALGSWFAGRRLARRSGHRR